MTTADVATGAAEWAEEVAEAGAEAVVLEVMIGFWNFDMSASSADCPKSVGGITRSCAGVKQAGNLRAQAFAFGRLLSALGEVMH